MSPGGPKVTYNGTVEGLVAKIHQDHPEFGAKLQAKIATVHARMLVEAAEKSEMNSTSLVKRDDVICCNFGSPCNVDITQGISYLRGVGGQPVQGPGPGSCGRVSCAYNGAIWWCNDVRAAPSLKTAAKVL